MISNAKKSISSHQIARELDMNQKSAWHMVMRIRQYMVEDDPLLKGIVEADETYIGGKPRGNNRGKRGRGTNKAPVVGIVERGGRVVAKHTPTVSAEDMKCFIIPNIAPEETVMMTDQFPAYNFLDDILERHTINHRECYVAEDSVTHTNTIESFWAIVKRAFHGTHHHYSKKWLHLYIVEACFKYNHRNDDDLYDSLMANVFA